MSAGTAELQAFIRRHPPLSSNNEIKVEKINEAESVMGGLAIDPTEKQICLPLYLQRSQ